MDCVPVLIYKNKASSPDVKNRYPLRYSLTYGETVEIRICRRTVPCNFAGRSSREAMFWGSEDRQQWLEVLSHVCERFNRVIHGYC